MLWLEVSISLRHPKPRWLLPISGRHECKSVFKETKKRATWLRAQFSVANAWKYLLLTQNLNAMCRLYASVIYLETCAWNICVDWFYLRPFCESNPDVTIWYLFADEATNLTTSRRLCSSFSREQKPGRARKLIYVDIKVRFIKRALRGDQFRGARVSLPRLVNTDKAVRLITTWSVFLEFAFIALSTICPRVQIRGSLGRPR